MKESRFWQEKKKLEEGLLKEISGDNNNFKDFFKRYKLEDTIYSSLGVVGGAYVLCDRSMNEMLYLQSRDLQRNTLQEHLNLPFLEIPYKYDPSKGKESVESSTKKEIVDAIFIGTLDHIKIQQPNNSLPKIYKHLPSNLSAEDFEKLLPFEKKFVEDGYKAIYCTVGEILFYLYLWRLLFRLIQERGIGKSGENSFVERKTYDRKIIQNFSLWDLNLGNELLPENDWMKAIYRYELKADTSNLSNEKLAAKSVMKEWRTITRTIDVALFEEFDFLNEYKYLGLVIEEEDSQIPNNRIAIRELLSLVQYLIHISKVYFKVNAFDAGQEQERKLPIIPKNFGDTISVINERQILYNLYVLEYRLNTIIQRGPQGKKDYFNLEHLNKKYKFDECLQFMAKKFLFEHVLKEPNAEKADLLKSLKAVHSKARFPILPYYYELALGEKHDPNEHLVLSIWNTSDEDVKIPFKFPETSKNSKEESESAVGFIALTMRPNWRIKGIKYPFTKNDQSIHWAKELSQKTIIRLSRIHSFFSTYSKPLIDRLFYGEFIKKQLKKASTSTDINAFSHELSKIIDNIFDLSNVSFQKLFAGNDNDLILREIQEFAREKNHSLSMDEIRAWSIIPNPGRFKVWSNYLQMWSGRTSKAVFGISLKEDLNKIIQECDKLAKDMYVGESMGRFHPAENFHLLYEYSNRFDVKKQNLNNNKKLILKYEGDNEIGNWVLAIRKIKNQTNKTEFKNRSTIRPNAFLRIMVAAITNIYEHSKGNFYLCIRVKNDLKGNSSLRFCFVNQCKKKDGQPIKKSFGTEPVINSCLALLDGTLECFGYPEEGIQEETWRKRTKLDSKKYDLWLTKFLIPIEGTFIK